MIWVVDELAVRELMESVRDGSVSAEEAVARLRRLPVADLGFARVDTHRALRQGAPEVVYAPGKTTHQMTAIVGELLALDESPVMVTRIQPEAAAALIGRHPGGAYVEAARLCVWRARTPSEGSPAVTIVSAGTADGPVAAEAAAVAGALGARVRLVEDVGVAGLHRVLSAAKELEEADVVIVVAGMEGALASVVGGLVEVPVVAVPTSAGYGAAFDGLAALLGMLTSCAAGVTVVNIDSGFGAAMAAFRLARAARRIAGGT